MEILKEICLQLKKILQKDSQPLSVVNTFQRNSVYMKSWVFRILKKEKILFKKNNYDIGILGLTYKENTNSLKNSPSLKLLKKFER